MEQVVEPTNNEELEMTIQPKVIDHLGINMYTNLHAVISELIANSFDANAHKVEITVPPGSISDEYSIIVSDDGAGMDFKELNEKYLQVGRNRREETKDARVGDEERMTLGRKGIGKFAVFGVAREVAVTAIKDGLFNKFKMDIEKIKAEKSGKYKPEKLTVNEKSSHASGVTVELLKLKRKNAINLEELRLGIAARFMLFSEKFRVYLNKTEITEADVKFKDIEYTKAIDEAVSEAHSQWRATGTVWGREGTIRESHNRGVALYARGKLVQEPTFFGATSGKEWSYPHLFGRLKVDFVDGENDVVSSNRSSINWESEEGQALATWGKEKMTDISREFNEVHVEKRVGVFDKFPETQELLSDLSPVEKKKAKKIVEALAGDAELPEERARDYISYVKNIVQYKAFDELAEQISTENPEQAALIVDLFRQWEHIEAREMYHVLRARMKTIDKMQEFIDTNAKEVPTIHKYLKQFPWLLDPRWTIVYDEVKYSTLLREKFKEEDIPEEDRRIDFLSFAAGPALIVVELKRPGKPIGVKDLEQLRQYVIFVKKNIAGNDPIFSPENVYGYLICEKQQTGKDVEIVKTDLQANRMYIRQYSDLIRMAKRIHQDFIAKYAEIKQLTQDQTAFEELSRNTSQAK
ncbi:MAG: ATP-binding protein [Nitrososphaerota archaeon]|jgi:hypothetical protein|nr:ATP-binding protein [Nitrososphaerota archaeon]